LAEHVTLGIMQRASARCVADGARGLAQRPDSFPTLPTIDVPTLVIVGEHDVLTPPDDARAIAQAVSGSELVTIEQAGHMSNLENPEAFNTALIAFLKTL
jgi:pimeloyl-ACP methyl ester carboxylesterase